MSKTKANTLLKGLLARLATARASLADAEVQVASVQLRIGIILSEAKEVIAEMDGVTFKDWLAKHYVGKSYETLNRWATAGATARVLGFTDESADLPPVYEVSPLYGVLQAAEKDLGREKAEESVREMYAKAAALKSGTVADNVAKAANRRLGKTDKAADGDAGAKGGNGAGPGNAGSPAEPVTVTIDPAAIESLKGELKRWNNRKVYEGVPHTTLNACRAETLRWVLEPGHVAAELLAAVSS